MVKKNKSGRFLLCLLIIFFGFCLAGCSASKTSSANDGASSGSVQQEEQKTPNSGQVVTQQAAAESPAQPEAPAEQPSAAEAAPSFDLASVPAYTGSPYIIINDNIPGFSSEELTTQSFETYAPLDSLGRVGVAYACVGLDLMPTEGRGDISEVHPTGWVQNSYEFVDGEQLYNRCHLIAHQLSGENANERNLMTGTRYLNTEGMLPFEEQVADYIRETGNHVLYRVTPVFNGDELVARGVQMEAESVEDSGAGVSYNVFCYNVEPGVVIDYATGENYADEAQPVYDETQEETDEEDVSEPAEPVISYVLNTNSMKFHYPDCSSVDDMSEKNRQDYSGTREEVINMGYSPCQRCNP